MKPENQPFPGDFLDRLNQFVARLIVLMAMTFVFVGGTIRYGRELIAPESLAQVRLQRAGYEVEPASVFRAIRESDPVALTRLQVAGIPLGSVQENGVSAFQYAIAQDDFAMLQTLADLGVQADLSEMGGQSPEVRALQAGSLSIVNYLMESGGNPNVEVSKGEPALVWVIRQGAHEAFDLLIRHGANIHLASPYGSPLSVALSSGNERAMDQLIELGADPDGLARTGQRLAVYALEIHRPDLANRFLRAGAKPNSRGVKGESLLEACFRHRDEEMFRHAVRAGGDLARMTTTGQTLLERAAMEQDLPWMEVLLSHGADPNQRTAERRDPLWWDRFQAGRPVEAEKLLQAGADINAPDPNGLKPIENAVGVGDFRVARYLFSRGAKTRGNLWDPLRSKDYDMLRLVMANGDDLNNPTSVGATPLGFAVMTADLTATALLMEYGARFDPEDQPGGHSLLEWSIANRQQKMTELLIHKGADVNARLSSPVSEDFLAKFKDHGSLVYYLQKDYNLTPLMLVAGSRQLEMAELLMENGASRLKYTKRHGTYPVTFAINSKNLPMAQLMLGREPEFDGKHKHKIVVTLSQQRARFYRDGNQIYSTRCSTGKSGYRTPRGTYVITDKARLRHSTIYGSAMPYFMRLSGSAIGMHQGNVPNYPASHGCVRLPYTYAKKFWYTAKVGDIIVIQ